MNEHHVTRKSYDATKKKCPHVVHFNIPCDWFETNSRRQKRYSEDDKSNNPSRKQSFTRLDLKTLAFRFRVNEKHFEDESFQKRWRHVNHVISLPSFPQTEIQNCWFIVAFSNSSYFCPGLNASIVELVLHVWQGYLTSSYYFIFDRIVWVLVTVYQWGPFLMRVIRNLNLIRVQS